MAPYEYSKSKWSQLGEGLLVWLFHRPRTSIGIILGFIGGFLFHWLGFWDTLILIICVTLGWGIGRYLDSRQKMGQLLDRLFTSDQ